MSANLEAVAAAARNLADMIDGAHRTDSGLWSPTVAASLVVKSVPEQRFTLGVAYPALRADAKMAVDGRRDACSAETLERTAWSWLTKSRRIGLFHGDLLGMPGGANEGHGTPCESYIWRADPWVIAKADGTTQTVMPGDWLLGVEWDVPTWNLIKMGRIDGFSVQGKADIRPASPHLLASLRT